MGPPHTEMRDMEIQDMRAFNAMRFAVRMQAICDELDAMGNVPEGYFSEVDSLKASARIVKERAWKDFVEGYEVRTR